MATDLEKLNHRRDQIVRGHAERKQKRATELQQTKNQATAMVERATDRAERDQKNEDATLDNHLSNLNTLIAKAKRAG
jgi:hypothetical protein